MLHPWAARISLAGLVLGMAVLLMGMQRPDPDPYVLLDAAKQTLGKGRLDSAGRMLSEIPLGQAEPFVDEEILFERLLVTSSELVSLQTLVRALEQQKLQDSAYCKWLVSEHTRCAQEFSELGLDYLNRTKDGFALDFVRFRLPLVSDEHLQDVLLMTDPVLLSAACTNWDDGRDGLGRGLVASQARVALVLAAAVHYDRPQATATVEQVSQRLRKGVPLNPALVLDWLADSALRYSLPNDGLKVLARAADTRLAGVLATAPDAALAKRMAERSRAKQNANGGEASQ